MQCNVQCTFFEYIYQWRWKRRGWRLNALFPFVTHKYEGKHKYAIQSPDLPHKWFNAGILGLEMYKKTKIKHFFFLGYSGVAVLCWSRGISGRAAADFLCQAILQTSSVHPHITSTMCDIRNIAAAHNALPSILVEYQHFSEWINLSPFNHIVPFSTISSMPSLWHCSCISHTTLICPMAVNIAGIVRPVFSATSCIYQAIHHCTLWIYRRCLKGMRCSRTLYILCQWVSGAQCIACLIVLYKMNHHQPHHCTDHFLISFLSPIISL